MTPDDDNKLPSIDQEKDNEQIQNKDKIAKIYFNFIFFKFIIYKTINPTQNITKALRSHVKNINQ